MIIFHSKKQLMLQFVALWVDTCCRWLLMYQRTTSPPFFIFLQKLVITYKATGHHNPKDHNPCFSLLWKPPMSKFGHVFWTLLRNYYFSTWHQHFFSLWLTCNYSFSSEVSPQFVAYNFAFPLAQDRLLLYLYILVLIRKHFLYKNELYN